MEHESGFQSDHSNSMNSSDVSINKVNFYLHLFTQSPILPYIHEHFERYV